MLRQEEQKVVESTPVPEYRAQAECKVCAKPALE
jgi:hypothetical protein